MKTSYVIGCTVGFVSVILAVVIITVTKGDPSAFLEVINYVLSFAGACLAGTTTAFAVRIHNNVNGRMTQLINAKTTALEPEDDTIVPAATDSTDTATGVASNE